MSIIATKEKLRPVSTASLWTEITQLRSAVINVIGRDEEGSYRPEFVKKILKASLEKADHKFQDPQLSCLVFSLSASLATGE